VNDMGLINQTCWCGKTFQAQSADVTRGWGKACCKSHAAYSREKKLDRFGFQKGQSGTFNSRMHSTEEADHLHHAGMDAVEYGWDGHKNVF